MDEVRSAVGSEDGGDGDVSGNMDPPFSGSISGDTLGLWPIPVGVVLLLSCSLEPDEGVLAATLIAHVASGSHLAATFFSTSRSRRMMSKPMIAYAMPKTAS